MLQLLSCEVPFKVGVPTCLPRAPAEQVTVTISSIRVIFFMTSINETMTLTNLSDTKSKVFFSPSNFASHARYSEGQNPAYVIFG